MKRVREIYGIVNVGEGSKKGSFTCTKASSSAGRPAWGGKEGKVPPRLSLQMWVKHAEPHFSSLSTYARGLTLFENSSVCRVGGLSPPLLGSDSLPVSSSVERQRRTPIGDMGAPSSPSTHSHFPPS